MYRPYPKYKPTNIPWVADIPENWGSKKLKFVSKIQPSNVDKLSKPDEIEVLLCNYVDVYKNDFINSKIPFMIATASISEIEKYSTKLGDVLITKDSETPDDIGNPAFVEEEIENLLCGYHLCQIRTKKAHILGKYLFRLFQTHIMNAYFETQANGVTRFGLGVDSFKNVITILPSLQEQHSITDFLNYKTALIDELITKKERLIEILQEEKTAIVNQAITKGLNKNVKLKDTGIEWLGKIPDHWVVNKVKRVSEIFGRIGYRGYTIDDIVAEKEGAITISPSNMINGYLDLTKCTYLSWDKYNESEEIKIFENDILLVKTGSTIGKVAYVQNVEYPLTINPQIAVFKNIKCLNKFLFYYIATDIIQNQFTLSNSGSTIPTMAQEEIGNYPIPLPPIDEQTDIVSFIENKILFNSKTVSKIENEIELLYEYRTVLITEAVTGKIDVRGYV